MNDIILGSTIGGVIALVGVIYGHWVKRSADKESNKVQLVTEQNDQEIEKKKLDFEVLKNTVETLRTDLASLRTRVGELEARLEVITRKYWRLVHVVRAWVSRYHIDPKEIPEDIREDL